MLVPKPPAGSSICLWLLCSCVDRFLSSWHLCSMLCSQPLGILILCILFFWLVRSCRPLTFLLVLLVWLLYVWLLVIVPSCSSLFEKRTWLLVIVPSCSSLFWSADLGVTSLGNWRYSPQCRSSRLRASSLSRALGCDDTAPQYASSLHGRRDCWWGVLRSVSHNRW